MTEVRELPAPPQERSGESEATREQERTSILRWLRDRGLLIYMTASLLVATPLKHERPEAAEIPPGATWSEGVQTLRNGVLSDKVEKKATFYIDNQADRGKWIFEEDGEVDNVKYKTTDIVESAEHELSIHPAQAITLCELHTHPLSGGESVDFISTEEAQKVREGKHSVSFPPSGSAMDGDLSIWNLARMDIALKKLAKRNVAVESRYGVVDASGITYHRIIDDQDLQHEFPDCFAEQQRKIAIFVEWKETIVPLVEKLDTASLDRLHQFTAYGEKYNAAKTNNLTPEEIEKYKQRDLFMTLLQVSEGNGHISKMLTNDNLKAKKLHNDFMTYVHQPSIRDVEALDQVRLDWIKTSMRVSPEQLPSTKEYLKLREAYARNGAYIRFVPHQNIPSEPPCAGSDYKP